MGKRNRKDKDPEKIRKKIRRLERRLDRQISDSDSHETYNESDHSISSNEGIHSIVSIPIRAVSEHLEPIPCTSVTSPQIPDESNVVNNTVAIPAISIDILDALGQSKNKCETFAPNVRNEISERWGKIIIDGLSKESLEKLAENIHIPENFKLLKAPELNIEISSILSESTKNRDKRLEKTQNLLGKGIAGVVNLMTKLIDEDVPKNDIIKKLSETGQLLLDLHCQNTSARRKLICYSMDKKFATLIQGVQRDSLLFGENLGERIKANKAAERSGLQVKRTFEPQPSTSYRPPQTSSRQQGNSRGPPRLQTQRGRRGGLRNQIPSQTHRRLQTTASTPTDRYNPQARMNTNKNFFPRN